MTERIRTAGPARLQIIVPARNEATRLPVGLERLCAVAATLPVSVEILVVDSASTDQTAQIVREWPAGPVPVRLMSCDRPGKGAAVRAGLLATTAPYVGFCDADMATDLSALDTTVSHLRAGRQMIIGSRSHPASVVEARHSSIRKAGAAAFRGMSRLAAPGPVDTQCGFKFFAGPVVRRAVADLVATGYAFDVELIARCHQLGADLIEIPVEWRDMPGSTFSVRRHAVAAFAELATIWLALRARPSRPAGDTEVAVATPVHGPAVPAATGLSAGFEAAGQ